MASRSDQTPSTKKPSMAESKPTQPKMPISERAKQFQPFAALAGLEEALRKKESKKKEEFPRPDLTS